MLVVLNRVRDEKMERYMQAKLAAKRLEPIGVIHEDAAIAMSWLEGAPLEVKSTRKDVEEIVKNLEAVAASSVIAI